jgi:hypothetical protein
LFYFEKVRDLGEIEFWSKYAKLRRTELQAGIHNTVHVRYYFFYTVLTVAVIKDSAGSALKGVLLVDAVVPDVCAAVEDGTVPRIRKITLGKTHTVHYNQQKINACSES